MTTEHWESRGTRAPDCGRRNRDGVPCYRGAGHGGRHLGTEAGGGSVSWLDSEPEGLAPEDAARVWLASPSDLSELCQGDSAAVRGARVVLALVAHGELGARLPAREGDGMSVWPPSEPPGAAGGAGALLDALRTGTAGEVAARLAEGAGGEGPGIREVMALLGAVHGELAALAGAADGRGRR